MKPNYYIFYARLIDAARFDWRESPQYESPGMTKNHYSAPLENGDRLHVYEMAQKLGREPDNHENWMYEIQPHDVPARLPLKVNPRLEPDMRYKGFPNLISWNTEICPDRELHERRSFSGWNDGASSWSFRNPEDAMNAVEQKYLEEAPNWNRKNHSMEQPNYYNDLNSFKEFL